MHFDKHFIKSVLPKAEILYDVFPEDALFSVDSRSLEKGEIFVAVKGNIRDGHEFITQAFEKGAAGFIINSDKKEVLEAIDKNKLKNKLVILVDDTAKALRSLASAWRLKFSYPVIGITGSFGKTSTKETISNIVKIHGFNALVSKGNQNTLLSVPLNVLRMRDTHQVAIFELGINKRGEMSELVEIIKPTIGLITAIGHAHMEGLGSLADISAEKREIFKLFKEDNIGIINGDQAQLSQIGYNHPVIKFGSKFTNQIQARKIKVDGATTSFVLKIYRKKYNVTLNTSHTGCVFNSLAATAACCLLNIPDETIIRGIQNPVSVKGRFEFKQLTIGNGKLIDDCYNASPESVKAGLQAFERINSDAQKIVVLGDMFELGVDSSFWHRQIGRFLRKVPSLNHLILVGDLVKSSKITVPVNLKVELVKDWQEAVNVLEKIVITKESLIFVKGSTRGYTAGLVNLVNHFTKSTPDINLAMGNKETKKENWL